MPGEARKRWAILAEVIRSQETPEERLRREGTKRSFHSYNLLLWGTQGPAGWRRVSHAGVEVEVRLDTAAASPSLTQLVGFNNTGNVCVWPSEECLAVYCLQHSASSAGLRVLELGGGMTGLAGLLLAATGLPASVTLTDGNSSSVASLELVVERAEGRGGSRLEAFPLRWDKEEAVEARRGQYDLVLSADCVFFTSQLAGALAVLLAPGGRALVMAPGREGSLHTFQEEAGQRFSSVREVERYSGLVWKAHEACLGLGDYTEDIHYPRLLELVL